MRKRTVTDAWLLLCIMFGVFLLAGCKKEDKASGISGTMSVSGGGADGVQIMIFRALTNIHSANNIWGENARFPAAGFAYTPQAGFSWRSAQDRLQASAVTGSDGKFEFPSLSDGDYLIVARKDGYGWTEPLPAPLQGGNLDVGTLRLFPEEIIAANASITQNAHWLGGHHYIIQERAILEQGVTLTVDPGATVRFGSLGILYVKGTLISTGTPDSVIHFTSANIVNPLFGDWQCITYDDFADTPPHFCYSTFDYAQTGILASKRGGTIENCYFANMTVNGMELNGSSSRLGDSLVVQYNMFDGLPVGMHITNVQSPTYSLIAHNLLQSSKSWGLEYLSNKGGQIYCNYANYSGRPDSTAAGTSGAVTLFECSDTNISNNFFNNSWHAVETGSYVDSSVIILNNLFRDNPRGSACVYIGLTDSRRGPSFPTIQNNCFEGADYTVFVTNGRINTHAIDATGNYWGTSNEAYIQQHLRDCADDPTLPCVSYVPILTACPQGVGLCSF